MLKLFSSIVTPVLLYCCEIWGLYLLGRINSIQMFKSHILRLVVKIEKLHLKFCKRISGVNGKATDIAVYGEVGKTPLII